MKQWIRTCQECSHEQVDTHPKLTGNITDAYKNRKCKKCKSPGSLDYGEWNVLTVEWK